MDTPRLTASVHAAETMLFSVLLQLIVMIGAARLFNSLARRLGQPGVIGEIVAGLALGPSLFGHFVPGASAMVFGHAAAGPITIISQIGLILLMFQIGADFDFSQVKSGKYRVATVWIAIASIAVPLVLGTAFGRFSAGMLAPGIDPQIYSLFCGVAVAITAVPILGRILREFGLTQHPVGVIAISAAAINDVVGWLLLACISAYATAHLSGSFLIWRGIAILAGVAVLWFVMPPSINRLLQTFPMQDGIIPANVMAIVICLTFAFGLATSSVGVFTIFGGFAAGLLFHRHPSFVEAWRHQVGQFVLVFFLPVFFTFTGLRTNILGVSSRADLGWLALVLCLSVLGKMVPVYLAARVCRLGHWQSLLLGSLMNTRALMELIVLNIGYDLGFLPQRVFTMLVIMAVVTTMMTGPLLQILLPRIDHKMRRVEA